MRALGAVALSLALTGCFADHGASAGVPCPGEVCPVGRTCQICPSSFRCVLADELTGCEAGLPFGLQLGCDGDEDCAGGERCVAYVADLSEGMRCSAFECECADGCPLACHDDTDCDGCGACMPHFGEDLPGRTCAR